MGIVLPNLQVVTRCLLYSSSKCRLELIIKLIVCPGVLESESCANLSSWRSISQCEFLSKFRCEFLRSAVAFLGRFTFNKLKTTPTPNKNGSYGIKGGGQYGIFWGSICHIFCRNPLTLTDFLCHTDPHCMAYFGGIFFANMGGGGGQNYFHT